jgi:hypothetical protein
MLNTEELNGALVILGVTSVVTPCSLAEVSIPRRVSEHRVSELGTTLAVIADSFHLDGGGDTFLRNVGSYRSHTTSHPRRRHFTQSPPWKPVIWHNRDFFMSLCKWNDIQRIFWFSSGSPRHEKSGVGSEFTFVTDSCIFLFRSVEGRDMSCMAGDPLPAE